MCVICPKCGAIAEYNAYYGRITCTRCSWESEKRAKPLNTYKRVDSTNNKIRKMAKA